MKTLVNGHRLEVGAAEALKPPFSASGVFETLRLHQHTPLFWAEHWARFAAGCRWFKLQPAIDSPSLQHESMQLAEANGLTDGVVRYTAWQNATGGTEWRVDVTPPRPHMALDALAVTIGPSLPPADRARIYKHLDRGPWLNALHDARAAGFDEALLRNNQGHLVEGAVSNVFCVRDGIVRTPELASGALPGVIRAAVLQAAGSLGLPVQEGVVTVSDLTHASEIWLTNSLIGVRPVNRLEQRKLGPARPMLDALQAGWPRTGKSVWGA